MRLRQNQIWLKGGEYFRIVQLDRTEVQFKTLSDPLSGRGPHTTVTKKEFCRLLKDAELIEIKVPVKNHDHSGENESIGRTGNQESSTTKVLERSEKSRQLLTPQLPPSS